jgi:TetR/AcrR family transcriptional regulator, copper-responsive repressor
MVQNSETKRRGRPRAYDSEAALQQARDAFWRAGYAGTSLDDIAAATGMNRPSLYAAFGDKRALYLEALAQYWKLAFAEMREALAADLPLPEALMQVYEGALSIYFSGEGNPRGCFVVGTAVTEAVEDSEIRQSLHEGFQKFDADFEARFRAASKPDPAARAILATATMHSIAIRARTGTSRDELRTLARQAITVLCA